MDSPLDASVETLSLRVAQVQRLLVVRLGTFRRIVMRSAGIAYERELGLPENDWLLVSFIGMHEGPVLASEIAARLLYDKAQVSRVASRLVEAGLVLRDHDRGPLRLSKRGLEDFDRIQRILLARNRALLKSVSEKDLVVLDKVLDKLFASARALLEDERRLSPRPAAAGDQAVTRPGREGDSWRTGLTAAAIRPLIMPDLHVLLRLLRQSATLAYGRVTGLPDFDWLTLSNIAMSAPLTLTDLIVALDRDKSQVGRAVNRLIALGLAARHKERGVASEVVTITPAGEAAYDAIAREAHRRDERLTADLTVRERRALTSILDRLTQNALDLLMREKAALGR
jgi:DNA-binding MarR family transcriptional regulator